MNQTPSTNPVVSLKDGRVVATSKDVADFFGKQHNNVLAASDNLIGISVEAALNFKFCPYQAYEQGRSYRQFEMTRDGFTLLAMGFTGKKALQFKLSYIEAFNRMEAKLKTAPVAVSSGLITLTVEQFGDLVASVSECAHNFVDTLHKTPIPKGGGS